MALMAAQIVAEGRSDILDAILAPATRMRAQTISRNRASYSSLPAILALVQTTEMLDERAANSASDSSPWTKAWNMERIIQPRIDFRKDFGFDFFSGYNVISQLGKISAPSLIVVGETDFICPPAYAQIMKDGIPDSRLLIVENAAHGGFVEQHEFVLGKIRGFLLNERSFVEKPREIESLRSMEQATEVWLEGVYRLGLAAEFLK
jgi:pimeloyl-ACP methyl ester carboxylesterase